MANSYFFNHVTFNPDDPTGTPPPTFVDPGGPDVPPVIEPGQGNTAVRYRLSIEGGITLKPGLEPDVIRALVPPAIFDAMKITDEMTGTLEFWYRTSAGGAAQPDHAIKGVTIFDVEPVTLGQPKPNDNVRIVSYRLFMADLRHRFMAPRGGWVRRGKINVKKGGLQLSNSQLIQSCMEAMGYGPDAFDLDPAVDDRATVQDLDWQGNHAPTELKKILDEIEAAFCVKSSGRISIEMIGKGADPEVPAGQKLHELVLPGLDRRGKVVVFSSTPNPTINTGTLIGPNPDTWQYVALDKDAHGLGILTWEVLDKGTFRLLNGKEPATIINNDFKDVEEAYRVGLRLQMFRCIRLNPDKYPHVILRNVILGDGTNKHMAVMAKIARYDEASNMWYPGTEFVRCNATFLYGDDNNGQYRGIIQVEEFLGQVTEPTPAYLRFIPTANVRPLNDGELKVTYSHEVVDVTNGVARPHYFDIGYRAKLGGVEQLSDADLKGALLDPNTIFVPTPELVEYRENGEPQNLAELAQTAGKLARRYLRDSGKGRMISGKGFFPVELSGLVSEIQIDQQALRTTLKLNTWYMPHGGVRIEAYRKLLENGGKFPGQERTQEARAASGAASAIQPAVPLAPMAGTTIGSNPNVLLRVTAFCTGDEKYQCRGKKMPTAGISRNTGLTDAELGEDQDADFPVIALNVSRVGQKGHWIPIGTILMGVLRGQTDDSSPFPVATVEWSRPLGASFRVDLIKTGGALGSKTTASSWVYSVWDLQGNQIGTDLAPDKPRINGAFQYATKGLAYYDAAGVVHLAEAWESNGTGACS